MLEQESKILNINVEEITKKLSSIGAIKSFEGIISGEYYKLGDKKIRIRSEQRGMVVCVKHPVGLDTDEFKVREEIEVVIDDKASFVKILEYFDFKEYKKIYKKRTSFHYNDVKIEIDEYGNNIPPLLEIESESVDAIINITNKLGYKKEDLVSLSFSAIEELYKDN